MLSPAASVTGIPTHLGSYRVLAHLGSGAVAHAYLAMADEEQLGKLCVLKVLREELAHDATARTTFVDEAKLASRFSHPHLVQAFDVGNARDGRPFLILEYREGQTLRAITRAARAAGTQLRAAHWARVISQVLSGLHHAHNLRDYDGAPLNVIHGDLSPDDVVVGYDGLVSVIDFGVARIASHLSQSDSGIVKGKIGYMAPELIDDGAIVDRRADVFSVGVILWELLTGVRVASIGAPHFLSARAIPRVRSVAPDVDPALEAIVARAVELDPARRYASAKEMRDALEGYLAGRGDFPGQVGAWVAALFEGERRALKDAVEERLFDLARPRIKGHVVSMPRRPSGDR